jgi:hypothetical protein
MMGKRFTLRLCAVFALLFFSVGGAGSRSQPAQPTSLKNQNVSLNTVAPIDPKVSKYAVGDVDHDNKDEVAVDFGAAGIWLYDQGAWTQLAPENPEGLFFIIPGPSLYGNILADFGSMGLWRWEDGSWSQISEANVETMTSILAPTGWGSSGAHTLVADFGPLGLWAWPINYHTWWVWEQMSGENADYVIGATLHYYWGSCIADFGAQGLWDMLQLAQISAANAEYMTKGTWTTTFPERDRLVVDFGPLGLWEYHLPDGWTQITGANADYIIPADINADGADEFVGDFGALGLWLWDGAQWTALSGENAEFMISADVNGDGKDELAVDFGSLGLWLWDNGNWTLLTDSNPEYLVAADTNGDLKREILGDFGSAGLWMWDQGVWTLISPDNPD